MSINIGGVSYPGAVSQAIQLSKKVAEQAVTHMIKEVTDNPAKNIKEIQNTVNSPQSQFLDIKI